MLCRKNTSKKVFYPVSNATLAAYLDNVFGNAGEVLHAVLGDIRSTCVGVSDVFPYNEYMAFQSGLVIALEDIVVSVAKEIQVTGGIQLGADIQTLKLSKTMECDVRILMDVTVDMLLEKAAELNGDIAIAGTADSAADKSVSEQTTAVQFAAAVDAVLRRYRTINDLVGLTFSDVSGWDLMTFYYMEE